MCTGKKGKKKKLYMRWHKREGEKNRYYKSQTWLGFIKQFVFLVAVGGQKSLPRANK